jgi:hypothetical protein
MATFPTQTHPLLTTAFNARTDFTVLADYCENLAETLIENDDPRLEKALYGRLRSCLNLLEPTLLEPIPQHLIASLTVDVLPENAPRFEPECTELCPYCLALTNVLEGKEISADVEKEIRGLLYELMTFFTAGMKAPRWLRTAEGLTLL